MNQQWKYWESYGNLIGELASQSSIAQYYTTLLFDAFNTRCMQHNGCQYITLDSIELWMSTWLQDAQEASRLCDCLLDTLTRSDDHSEAMDSQEFILVFLLLLLPIQRPQKHASAYYKAVRQLAFLYYNSDGSGWLDQEAWNFVVDGSLSCEVDFDPISTQTMGWLESCTAECQTVCNRQVERNAKKKRALQQYFAERHNRISYYDYYKAIEIQLLNEPRYLFHWPKVHSAFTLKFPISPLKVLPVQLVSCAAVNEPVTNPNQTQSSDSIKASTKTATLNTDVEESGEQDNPPQTSNNDNACEGFEATSSSESAIVANVCDSIYTLNGDHGGSQESASALPQRENSENKSPNVNNGDEQTVTPRAASGGKSCRALIQVQEMGKSSLNQLASFVKSFSELIPETVKPAPIKGRIQEKKTKKIVRTRLLDSVVEPTPSQIAKIFDTYVVKYLRGSESQVDATTLLEDLHHLHLIAHYHTRNEMPFEKLPVHEGDKVCVVGSLNGNEKKLKDVLVSQFPELQRERVWDSTLNNSYLIFSGNYLDHRAGSSENDGLELAYEIPSSIRILLIILAFKAVFPARVKLLQGVNEHIGYDQLKKDLILLCKSANEANNVWDMVMDVLQTLPLGCSLADWGHVYGGKLCEPFVTVLSQVSNLPRSSRLNPSEPGSPVTYTLDRKSKANASEIVHNLRKSYEIDRINEVKALIRLRHLRLFKWIVCNGKLIPVMSSSSESDAAGRAFSVICCVANQKMTVDREPYFLGENRKEDLMAVLSTQDGGSRPLTRSTNQFTRAYVTPEVDSDREIERFCAMMSK